MAMVQTQVVSLPKLRTNSGRTPIPVVRHVIKNEDLPDHKNEV